MGPASLHSFNAAAFVDWAGIASRIVEYRQAEVIFSQGDRGDSVMYVQKGGVKLSVLSKRRREAVVAILGPGDFFGEGCLAGQPARTGSATAFTRSTIFAIEKGKMVGLLHEQRALADGFISHMLARTIRIEEALIVQLFDSTEKRLARTLLLLARYGKPGRPQKTLPKMSAETLADMVGTTPSRVTFFMNRFRRLGFIASNGRLTIRRSLLSVVLHE